MSTAFAICNNDSIEGVVVDDFNKARSEMNRLKKEHQKKITPCKEYPDVYFWHIHDVEIL